MRGHSPLSRERGIRETQRTSAWIGGYPTRYCLPHILVSNIYYQIQYYKQLIYLHCCPYSLLPRFSSLTHEKYRALETITIIKENKKHGILTASNNLSR